MSSTPALALPRECSVIVPVYRNALDIPDLLARLSELDRLVAGGIEAVFVVDGSPDDSPRAARGGAAGDAVRVAAACCCRATSARSPRFATACESRAGDCFAVMAADLQEPPELVVDIPTRGCATDDVDVVLGARESRDDPWPSRAASALFWRLYRALIRAADMSRRAASTCSPATVQLRDRSCSCSESNSSLVGQLFWLGFRRKLVPYDARARRHGRSAWTLRRKLRYLLDSIFAFSDLPMRVFSASAAIGLLASAVLGHRRRGRALAGCDPGARLRARRC